MYIFILIGTSPALLARSRVCDRLQTVQKSVSPSEVSKRLLLTIKFRSVQRRLSGEDIALFALRLYIKLMFLSTH